MNLRLFVDPETGTTMNDEPNLYPAGWDYERVREVIDYYETQSEDEAVAEAEAAFASGQATLMEVPQPLVPLFRQLIAEHQRNGETPR